MKALVVGLGSMGKRRIRCLQKLGVERIIGCDIREDRRNESEDLYGICACEDYQAELAQHPDVAFVCTPPDHHQIAALQITLKDVPYFTEAGIFAMFQGDLGMQACVSHLGHPSCTMRFLAGPKEIKSQVDSMAIGRPLSFVYHVGQWLPDWHPNEDYRRYYVSRRSTGACREIVPFELCWLTWVFGNVTSVMAYKGKLSTLDADIDDVYQLLLEFESGVRGMLQVDVQAHYATRHFHLVGSECDWVSDITNDESYYVDETRAFLDAVQGKAEWGYSYQDEARVLDVLTAAEHSDMLRKRVQLDY